MPSVALLDSLIEGRTATEIHALVRTDKGYAKLLKEPKRDRREVEQKLKDAMTRYFLEKFLPVPEEFRFEPFDYGMTLAITAKEP